MIKTITLTSGNRVDELRSLANTLEDLGIDRAMRYSEWVRESDGTEDFVYAYDRDIEDLDDRYRELIRSFLPQEAYNPVCRVYLDRIVITYFGSYTEKSDVEEYPF